MLKNLIYISVILTYGICQNNSPHSEQSKYFKSQQNPPVERTQIRTGLEIILTDKKELLKNKKTGLVTNHTGIDKNGKPNYLLFHQDPDIDLKIIFTPEHGLEGKFEAGEKIQNQTHKEPLPAIVSLYGSARKPSKQSIQDLDVIIYDIQDIGARFYTYISTLGLVMDAAAEANVPVMVLDRPNPISGSIVGGPTLDLSFQSFVGFYPIPIRYGLTIGELAALAAGEKWIPNIPELKIIKMEGWERTLWYDETSLGWISPSPNIPSLNTALVYPGTCLIEPTNLSEGRGTENPFLWIGAPWINGKLLSKELNYKQLPGVVFKPITFTPVSKKGFASHPKYEGEECNGIEIAVINRYNYESVRTGVAILQTINDLFESKLEIKESGLNRLWGNPDLSSHLLHGKPFDSVTDNTEFKTLTSRYKLYD